jgi:hypothetical protein
MGGDRPRNHVPARYVTVIDRAEGCVKFFYLDAKGCLIFDNGVPRLCKVEPYGAPQAPAVPLIAPTLGIEPEAAQGQADGPDETFGGEEPADEEFFGLAPDGEFMAYEMGNPFLM